MTKKFPKIFKITLLSIFILGVGVTFSGVFILHLHYLAPILTYHSIQNQISDKHDLLVVSARTFERQMRFIRQHKYKVISLRQLATLLKNRSPVPHNTVVITIDDGFENNFSVALPILKKYNIPATIFIVTSSISSDPNFLTWQQVREMSASGLIDFGSHTLTHAYLPDIKDRKELLRQIKGSKEVLERILKKPVDLFCYPAGGFNKEARQIVIDSGYLAAAATKPGLSYPDNDLYALKRIRVSEKNNDTISFWFKLTGFYTPFQEWQRRYKDKDILYGF